MSNRLTNADKVLIAAAALPDGAVFSAEELIVKAWEKFPDTFGLRGFVDEKGSPKYPDSNRVLTTIMGKKSLTNGSLEKAGKKKYRVTAAGKHTANVLSSNADSNPKRFSSGRETQSNLRRYLESRAMKKWLGDERDNLTFTDACWFWGITAGSRAHDLNSKLVALEFLVGKVIDENPGDEFVFQHGGDTVPISLVQEIVRLSEHLKTHLESDLAVIRERPDN